MKTNPTQRNSTLHASFRFQLKITSVIDKVGKQAYSVTQGTEITKVNRKVNDCK